MPINLNKTYEYKYKKYKYKYLECKRKILQHRHKMLYGGKKLRILGPLMSRMSAVRNNIKKNVNSTIENLTAPVLLRKLNTAINITPTVSQKNIIDFWNRAIQPNNTETLIGQSIRGNWLAHMIVFAKIDWDCPNIYIIPFFNTIITPHINNLNMFSDDILKFIQTEIIDKKRTIISMEAFIQNICDIIKNYTGGRYNYSIDDIIPKICELVSIYNLENTNYPANTNCYINHVITSSHIHEIIVQLHQRLNYEWNYLYPYDSNNSNNINSERINSLLQLLENEYYYKFKETSRHNIDYESFDNHISKLQSEQKGGSNYNIYDINEIKFNENDDKQFTFHYSNSEQPLTYRINETHELTGTLFDQAIKGSKIAQEILFLQFSNKKNNCDDEGYNYLVNMINKLLENIGQSNILIKKYIDSFLPQLIIQMKEKPLKLSELQEELDKILNYYIINRARYSKADLIKPIKQLLYKYNIKVPAINNNTNDTCHDILNCNNCSNIRIKIDELMNKLNALLENSTGDRINLNFESPKELSFDFLYHRMDFFKWFINGHAIQKVEILESKSELVKLESNSELESNSKVVKLDDYIMYEDKSIQLCSDGSIYSKTWNLSNIWSSSEILTLDNLQNSSYYNDNSNPLQSIIILYICIKNKINNIYKHQFGDD